MLVGIPACLQHATSVLEDEVERSGYARAVTPESLLMWAYEHRNWRYEEDGVQVVFLSAKDGELVVSPEGEVEFLCILPWRFDSDGL